MLGQQAGDERLVAEQAEDRFAAAEAGVVAELFVLDRHALAGVDQDGDPRLGDELLIGPLHRFQKKQDGAGEGREPQRREHDAHRAAERAPFAAVLPKNEQSKQRSDYRDAGPQQAGIVEAVEPAEAVRHQLGGAVAG